MRNDLKAIGRVDPARATSTTKLRAQCQRPSRRKLSRVCKTCATKIQQTYQDNQQALQKAQQEKMTPITTKLVNAIKAVEGVGGYVSYHGRIIWHPPISDTLSKDVTL